MVGVPVDGGVVVVPVDVVPVPGVTPGDVLGESFGGRRTNWFSKI